MSSGNGSEDFVQQQYKLYPTSNLNEFSTKKPRREFYEEMVERKRCMEHVIKANNYSKAQKKFRHFQSQLRNL